MKPDPLYKSSAKRNRAFLRCLVSFIFWAALFSLAYAQSPLYTSNQNQYFLHGLTDAGFGYLDQDWLANTLDPTPVFSGLIAFTGRFLPWPPIFYFYFTILAGIYLFSLYGIISKTFQINASIAKTRVLHIYLNIGSLGCSEVPGCASLQPGLGLSL